MKPLPRRLSSEFRLSFSKKQKARLFSFGGRQRIQASFIFCPDQSGTNFVFFGFSLTWALTREEGILFVLKLRPPVGVSKKRWGGYIICSIVIYSSRWECPPGGLKKIIPSDPQVSTGMWDDNTHTLHALLRILLLQKKRDSSPSYFRDETVAKCEK